MGKVNERDIAKLTLSMIEIERMIEAIRLAVDVMGRKYTDLCAIDRSSI